MSIAEYIDYATRKKKLYKDYAKGYIDGIEKRLKKAGITKGFQLPQGIDIMADSSDIGDKDYTKAQHDIRGGV